MKKLYTFCTLFFALSVGAQAVTHNVSVANNTFTPSTFSAVVGDVVTWTLSAGTHTTTSVSVPGGAATWDSGTLTSTPYSYTITTAGNYGYWCTYHGLGGMGGGFTVTTVGIIEPLTNLATSVYPNPFNDKVMIKYSGIESIEIINMLGEKVKTMELSDAQSKAEIDFAGMPAGVYFYRTYKEGTIVETRKIVKAN